MARSESFGRIEVKPIPNWRGGGGEDVVTDVVYYDELEGLTEKRLEGVLLVHRQAASDEEWARQEPQRDKGGMLCGSHGCS